MAQLASPSGPPQRFPELSQLAMLFLVNLENIRSRGWGSKRARLQDAFKSFVVKGGTQKNRNGGGAELVWHAIHASSATELFWAPLPSHPTPNVEFARLQPGVALIPKTHPPQNAVYIKDLLSAAMAHHPREDAWVSAVWLQCAMYIS